MLDPSGSTGRGCTVALVDDDPAVRGALAFWLEIEGFSVRSYGSADEFLAAGDLPAYGCLVVDHHLPGMSGLDLVSHLSARHVRLPIILITSHPSETVRRRAAGAAVRIIEKPLLGNALSEAIREALGGRLQAS